MERTEIPEIKNMTASMVALLMKLDGEIAPFMFWRGAFQIDGTSYWDLPEFVWADGQARLDLPRPTQYLNPGANYVKLKDLRMAHLNGAIDQAVDYDEEMERWSV